MRLLPHALPQMVTLILILCGNGHLLTSVNITLRSAFYIHRCTHTGETPVIPCSVCEMEFPNIKGLMKDLRNEHYFRKIFSFLYS